MTKTLNFKIYALLIRSNGKSDIFASKITRKSHYIFDAF